jgi:hypothetical protein
MGVAAYDTANNKLTAAPAYTDTYTEANGASNTPFKCSFSSPVSLSAGTAYMLFVVRTDSTTGVSQTANSIVGTIMGPGLYLSNTSGATAMVLSSTAPGTSDTWSSIGGRVWGLSMLYTV